MESGILVWNLESWFVNPKSLIKNGGILNLTRDFNLVSGPSMQWRGNYEGNYLWSRLARSAVGSCSQLNYTETLRNLAIALKIENCVTKVTFELSRAADMMGDCAESLLLDSTQGIPALTSLPRIFLRHNCAITNT